MSSEMHPFYQEAREGKSLTFYKCEALLSHFMNISTVEETGCEQKVSCVTLGCIVCQWKYED